MDTQLLNLKSHLSELPHQYGEKVHLLARPLLLSQLAELCAPQTEQPRINELITSLYRALLETVVEQEFQFETVQTPTRMHVEHPEAVYQGPHLVQDQAAVCVNLARAGTLPSHVCYDALNRWLTPMRVRQDHISIARVVGPTDQVQGSAVSGHKIGGSTEDAIVLFPDPMGATGGTLIEALNLYKAQAGRTRKFIAMHCIVTPEYLKRVHAVHPELIVYAIRLDRGLSSSTILSTPLGSHWDQEKGLNSRQYIIPGGGGFGEILNNAYV